MSAAEMGNYGAVVRLLNRAPELIDIADNRQRTPLWLAARKGRDRAVLALIEAGADVNSVDRLGRTALRVAVEKRGDRVRMRVG